MNDLRKAAEMALAKLDHLWEIAVDERMNTDVLPEIKALRQALAQPEQEPIAWINGYGFWKYKPKGIDDLTPLYTAPPCQTGAQCIGGKCPECEREWVGLTDEEIEEYRWMGQDVIAVIKEVQATLKEKNGG